MTWNEKKHLPESGVNVDGGHFQKISDVDKRIERLIIRFTKNQLQSINEYCKENRITKSALIRNLIYRELSAQEIDFEPDKKSLDYGSFFEKIYSQRKRKDRLKP